MHVCDGMVDRGRYGRASVPWQVPCEQCAAPKCCGALPCTAALRSPFATCPTAQSGLRRRGLSCIEVLARGIAGCDTRYWVERAVWCDVAHCAVRADD